MYTFNGTMNQLYMYNYMHACIQTYTFIVCVCTCPCYYADKDRYKSCIPMCHSDMGPGTL